MEKYLIVLDLDNTLIGENNCISELTKNTLLACQKLGCKIVINTARSYIRTKSIAKEINADFICCFNGNFVCNKEMNILYSKNISKKYLKDLIKEFIKFTDTIICEGVKETIIFNTNNCNKNEFEKIFIERIKEFEVYKIILKDMKESYIKINSLVKKYNLTIFFSRDKKTIKILPFKTDKWVGVNNIREFLKEKYKTIAFGDDISDLKTLLNSDIGIRMENSALEIKEIVNYSTLSNEDNGVAKFLQDYFNLEQVNNKANNIKLLDCSLRDGGHLNKSNFGYTVIKSFITKLVLSNIDIIEIGFLQNSQFNKNCAIYPTVKDAERILEKIECSNSTFSLLTQVDKFDISKLEPCFGKLKMIRVSFHNNLIDLGIEYCKNVKQKGYLCTINPINFSNYSKEEIFELISKVNKVKPDFFYIVDTFGTLLNSELRNKLKIINYFLDKDIKIGIHLHENLNSAFSLAQDFIDFNMREGDCIIDTSVAGIGRTPGNLKTEILSYYINNLLNKEKYSMKNIYSLIENEIFKLKENFNWDNNFAFGISAFEKVHRTYAECLNNKGFSLEKIEKLIKLIPNEDKKFFTERFIDLNGNCFLD